jgi:hypothetical protein
MLIDHNGKSVSLPDFFIVGAPRCGTSTLYSYLLNHPSIFMPVEKEPMFFSCWNRETVMDALNPEQPLSWAVREPEDYLGLFLPAREDQTRGEASTWYLAEHERVLSNMASFYGSRLREVKIIITLRNPANRAWSQYLQKRSERQETLDFKAAIQPDVIASRKEKNFSPSFDYIGFSKYSPGVSAYLERFDKVLMIIFEEFFPCIEENILKVFDFLGVASGDRRMIRRQANVSGLPRGKLGEAALGLVYKPNALKSFTKAVLPRRIRTPLKYTIKGALLKHVPLDSHLRQELQEEFREDVAELERLLGRDLSLWQENEKRPDRGAAE